MRRRRSWVARATEAHATGDETPENVGLLEVGRRVEQLRKLVGLTQSQLAKAAGMSNAYVVEIENHGANLSLNALLRLAKALNVSPGSLFPAAPTDPHTARERIAETLHCTRRARELLKETEAKLERLLNDS
jgi:transcriptional regulator with XRE-family HTH domain